MRAQGGAGTFPENPSGTGIYTAKKTAPFTTASCPSPRDPISSKSAAAPRGAVDEDSGRRKIDVNTPYGVIYLSQPFNGLRQTGKSMIMLAASSKSPAVELTM